MRTSRLAPLLLLAPLLAAPCDAQQTRTTTSSERTVLRGDMVGVFSTNGRTEHVWIDTGRGIDVRAAGEVALRDDAADVASVPAGGYLTAQQRVGSALHRAEWHPAAGGGVARSYTVNGERRDFAEARPWLDRFFPEVLRHTSIGARARFTRVLAQRGVSGVLEEAAAMESGSARQVYLEGLADRDLTPAETQRFLRAVSGIGSSSTRRDILLKMVKRPLSADGWSAWLDAAGSVTSGSDRRELLRGAVAAYPRGQALPAGFFRALDGMSSSSDRREVLTALLAARGSEPGTLARALESTAKLSSSSDRREVLEQAAALPASAGTVAQYLHVVRGSSSSSDQRDALTALLRNRAALRTSAAATAWLGAVGEVRSDSDKAALLMAAIGRLPADRQVRTAFSAAVETLSSDTYYNQVATAYLRSQAGS